MKTLLPVILLLLFCPIARADEPYNTEPPFEKMATVIRRIENNPNYGVLSVKCETEAACRRICLNSLKNSHKRWIKAGKPKPFDAFFADRWCPVKAHSLNKNWLPNFRYYMAKNKKVP